MAAPQGLQGRAGEHAAGLIAVLGIVLALSGCTRTPQPEQFAGPTMGTTYSVTVAGPRASSSRQQVQSIIDRALLDADSLLSTYDEASEISALNRDETQAWQEVSPALYAVLKEARDASDLTGGAFDITVAPLLALWGYDHGAADGTLPAAFQPPTVAQLEAARRSVGYSKLELRDAPRAAFRKRAAGMRVTVDGIAPGYVVDRIAEELRAAGHSDFIVEIGGEVRAHGQRPGGGPWRIAVEAPLAVARKALVGIRLHDAAASTSGDYREARVDTRGRRYSHTIDPRTGSTVGGALTSVTVIHPTASLADAYATALMVMGTEAGLGWATQLRLPVLFVERTGQPDEWRLVESPAFQEWRE